MKPILRQSERDAIFRSQDTQETSYSLRRVGSIEPHDPNAVVIKFPHPNDGLPDHDWTQHTLGDREDWGIPRHVDASTDPNVQFPGMENMQPTGQTLGTHSSKVYSNPSNNEQWLVKQAPKASLASGDVAASAIQQHSGLSTPPTFLTQSEGSPASAQLMYPGAKDAFPGKQIDPEMISDPDLMTLQKHHALDWMIGNHDAHGGQFIRDNDGNLVGIDKGQAFKYFNQDRLHWNFNPNGAKYNEVEPVYNTLYRNYAKGGRPLFDPREGELGNFVNHLSSIPDDEYRDTLRPYAEQATAEGGLAKYLDPGSYGLPEDSRGLTNHPEAFLDHAVARKNSLAQDMGQLYDRATAARMTGTKIARRLLSMPAPDPSQMEDSGEEMGSHGSTRWTDPQGSWLMKRPNRGNEFLVPLETAVARLQRHSGLETPETYSVPMPDTGDMANAVKIYQGATHPWEKEPHLDQLNEQDLDTIQKHHALDWMIGNHDAHVGNWMRTPEGKLVGFDKGQSLKYFGRDRLDDRFHPNYYAREPIYNRLWRDHAKGRGEMKDPREGELGAYVKGLQAIPDDKFKALFHPFVHAAAQAGMLGTGGYGKGGKLDPQRGLSDTPIPPNDPEAFLNGMVDRKNRLSEDLGNFYDQQTAKRTGLSSPAAPASTPATANWSPPPKTSTIHDAGLGDLVNMGIGLGTGLLNSGAGAGVAGSGLLNSGLSSGLGTGLGSSLGEGLLTSLPGLMPKTPGLLSQPATQSTTSPTQQPSGATTQPAGQSGATAQTGYNPASSTKGRSFSPTGIPNLTQQHQPSRSNGGGTTVIMMSPYGSGMTTMMPGGVGVGGYGMPGYGMPAGYSPYSSTTPGSTPSSYNPSAGVSQWSPQIQQALQRNGLPVTPEYMNRVEKQVQSESSGNPKAINTTDSNATAGHPSQGLLQTIPSTFNQYHLPGDSNDITDPQANLDAAIGYAKSRYGPTLMDSEGNGIGSQRGY